MAKRSSTPEVCPVCHEDVPPGSLACPECGADHRSGWNEEATYLDGLDLPNFDEDEPPSKRGPYLNSPRPKHSAAKKRKIMPVIWWITAVLLLGGFMWDYLGDLIFSLFQ